MKYLAMIPCETCVMQVREAEQVRFVYMIQCEATARIKIGIADDVDARVADIQRMSPTKLNVVAEFPSDGATLEGYFHRVFERCRVHGEWFDPDDQMIEQIETYKQVHAREKEAFRRHLES